MYNKFNMSDARLSLSASKHTAEGYCGFLSNIPEPSIEDEFFRYRCRREVGVEKHATLMLISQSLGENPNECTYFRKYARPTLLSSKKLERNLSAPKVRIERLSRQVMLRT